MQKRQSEMISFDFRQNCFPGIYLMPWCHNRPELKCTKRSYIYPPDTAVVSGWINIRKSTFPCKCNIYSCFWLFIIRPYSCQWFLHVTDVRLVFQSRAVQIASATILYMSPFNVHQCRGDTNIVCVCVRESERLRKGGRSGYIRERKKSVWHWGLLAALVSLALPWMAAICPRLSWHSNLSAGPEMVGDLFSLLFCMNANSGIARPAVAFTLVQSRWLKWLCDTACALSLSLWRSLIFSVSVFFFLSQSLAMRLFISRLLLCDIKPVECFCIIFQSMVFSFSTIQSI